MKKSNNEFSPIPFKIAVPERTLEDLHRRLDNSRFLEGVEGAAWSEGMDLETLRALISHWRNLKWRAIEAKLNEFPSFHAEVNGQRLHYVHVRGEGSNSVPIILTNGWPSCFTEFLTLVPLLTKEVNGVSFD